MIRSFPRSAIVGIFFFTLSVSIGSAQGTSPTYPEGFDEPMPLYEAALGKFTRPITSTSKKAQAFFDQEARSELGDQLLGRGVGLGPVSERPYEFG